MLPGFRFLFAAIVLSMSILIFGLGAAALLRSAHEEFASLPSRRVPAGPVFTRQSDPPMPTLALLRFEPPAADDKPQDVPTALASEDVTPAEQAQEATPAAPEKLAALKPEEPMPVEVATPVAPAEVALPLAAEEIKVAATSEASEPSTTAAAPANDSISLEGNNAATMIATLGGPAVIIQEKTVSNITDARPDRSVVRKRSAQRARERRRIAARRARVAARQAATAAGQQQTPQFGQTSTVRTP